MAMEQMDILDNPADKLSLRMIRFRQSFIDHI
jgi:hypothetical protein